METAKRHVKLLIERAETVNSSEDYPDCVSSLKITSEYPIQQRSTGVHVAYLLTRKKISQTEYSKAAQKLRERSTRSFDNIVQKVFYPETAIHFFLKSRSHVLKLRKYSEEDFQEIEGHII